MCDQLVLEQVQVLSVISWCWSRRRCCLLLTGGARITMVTKVGAHSVSYERVLIKLSFNYTSQILTFLRLRIGSSS